MTTGSSLVQVEQVGFSGWDGDAHMWDSGVINGLIRIWVWALISWVGGVVGLGLG